MNGTIVKSTNFEFLRTKWPELATLGGFAEQYARSDPSSALLKLRLFAEYTVVYVYDALNLPKPDYHPNLNDLLNFTPFMDAVPRSVTGKLHILRTKGNAAAHGKMLPADTSLWVLEEAFDLAKWLFLTFVDQNARFPGYKSPPEDGILSRTKDAVQKQRTEALKLIAAKESELRELLEKLNAEREKAKAYKLKAEELQARVRAGRDAASTLNFDEAATRKRLVDIQLAEAGWNVGSEGAPTDEVTQEVKVRHQPTESGVGYADYVLWDDNGKPLAVVEAKKTSKSAELGKKQAQFYADGLEKEHGLRPMIFYTNGFDIFVRDDHQGYPPRRIHGFYSKDSLQYRVAYQRNEKQDLSKIPVNPDITDRVYQQEAIRRVCEGFEQKQRKALIVQATGTGKTRVAISLTDRLYKANWVHRVLFLCDRKELRKQAKNAFGEYTSEPVVVMGAGTAKVRDKRIYLATYPAMSKIYRTFDTGFFDLIVADESHRSIYNRYREIFQWFDGLHVGLTATPVDFIQRNTFRLFGCEDKSPTFYYSFERAVDEKYLVPYEVYTHTTRFLREGIKYKDLTDEQKKQLEDDGENPELFDYEAKQIDKRVFNKETNRLIVRKLMENGVRDADGQLPGKTIVFARNHNHAVLLSRLFDEMYPQYGGKLCHVIDNYDPRAEPLIDDFKDPSNPLTVAVSVDMLDTGIDVPEVVNLVFAKPVFSLVKFEQMIGRGTRLCENLLGTGKHKRFFRIFDHWGNFEYFDKDYVKCEPKHSKSLMQRVFETRVVLAETLLAKGDLDAFKYVAELIRSDIEGLSEETIAVREKWKTKRSVSSPETLQAFAPTTVATLRKEIAPLMQWRDIRGFSDAYFLDGLIADMQKALLADPGRFEDLRIDFLERVNRLPMNLSQVQDKKDTIDTVKSVGFWNSAGFSELETVRQELRGIMKYCVKQTFFHEEPKTIDISDGGVEFKKAPVNFSKVEMAAYEKRVEEALKALFDENRTLKKIRAGESVNESDLKTLTSLVLTRHPDVDLNILKSFYNDTAQPLDFIIRRIIGLDPEAVKRRFEDFIAKHPMLTADQTRFLGLLQNHISRNGAVEIDRLYEPPFTTIHSDGIDGIFTEDADIDDLIAIISDFNPENLEASSLL